MVVLISNFPMIPNDWLLANNTFEQLGVLFTVDETKTLLESSLLVQRLWPHTANYCITMTTWDLNRAPGIRYHVTPDSIFTSTRSTSSAPETTAMKFFANNKTLPSLAFNLFRSGWFRIWCPCHCLKLFWSFSRYPPGQKVKCRLVAVQWETCDILGEISQFWMRRSYVSMRDIITSVFFWWGFWVVLQKSISVFWRRDVVYVTATAPSSDS